MPTYALNLWNTTESCKVTVLVFPVLNALFLFKVANLILRDKRTTKKKVVFRWRLTYEEYNAPLVLFHHIFHLSTTVLVCFSQ